MEVITIKPQPKQESFLQSDADIAVYGGSAGGGKTYALLLESLRHINNKLFGCVGFRRTSPQITTEGGLWDTSVSLYTLFNAIPSAYIRSWKFPSGAKIKFSHMQHEKNMFDYQGAQIPLILFDELVHFTYKQFFYMLSRNRSICGIKPYIRATCNPDSESWVADLVSWWIDQDTGYPDINKSGIVRYFINDDNDGLLWSDDARDLTTKSIKPKSFTFIPANVYDNQILLDNDPTYLSNLQALPLIERERLLYGNWKIKPNAGTLFDKSWIETVDYVPNGGITIRFWDFAATEKTVKKKNPDYTASVLMRYVNKQYYILDCTADRISPDDIDRKLMNLAIQDKQFCLDTDSSYKIRWEREPASAGIRETSRLISMLNGFDSNGIRPQGDKITRFRPFTSQASNKKVFIVKGSFNQMWLNHLHNQPNLDHDDIMDATSGAYNATLEGGYSTMQGLYR